MHKEKTLEIKLLNEQEIIEVFSRFKANNPNPKTELNFTNPYTCLVSVALSAQTTDKAVNKATESLYKIADTPQKMLDLGEEKLIEYIKTIGLYRNKAKNVIRLSQMLRDNFNGEVPKKREDLESLPGVGRKTANVVLNVVYGEPTMPVDTHLLRISPKIGLSSGQNPLQVEKDLLANIPFEFLEHAHHWLILHGRYTCIARKPKCSECIIEDICKKNGAEI